jgi:hypothetical protein
MVFKPNYNMQRTDRSRSKEKKKQEKLQRREEETAKRRAARGETSGDSEHESGKAPGEG